MHVGGDTLPGFLVDESFNRRPRPDRSRGELPFFDPLSLGAFRFASALAAHHPQITVTVGRQSASGRHRLEIHAAGASAAVELRSPGYAPQRVEHATAARERARDLYLEPRAAREVLVVDPDGAVHPAWLWILGPLSAAALVRPLGPRRPWVKQHALMATNEPRVSRGGMTQERRLLHLRRRCDAGRETEHQASRPAAPERASP